MKRLTLLFLLFSSFCFGQISYGTSKILVYVKTSKVHGAKPYISDFNLPYGSPKGTKLICVNLRDSVAYENVNGAATLTKTAYPFKTGKKVLVTAVTITSTVHYSTTKQMYYILVNTIAGNLPLLTDAKTSIYKFVNTTDSIVYDKYNGARRSLYVVYNYAPKPITPEPCLITYSPYDSCHSDGYQYRTILSITPSGCTGAETAVLKMACAYIPPTYVFEYSLWSACDPITGLRTRSVIKSTPPSGGTGTPVLTEACTYIPPVAAHGTHFYYVSPAGSDSYTKTQANNVATPWKTLNKAATTAVSSGDTIFMQTGSYTDVNMNMLKVGVNILGEGTDKTFINLTYPSNSGIYLTSATIVNGNQFISGIAFSGVNLTGHSAINITRVGNVSVNNCSFTNFLVDAVFFVNASGSAPSAWVPNNKFINNIIINCVQYTNSATASLYITGQQNFTGLNNTIISVPRGSDPAGFGVKTNYTRGLIWDSNIVNNRTNDDNLHWSFCMELWNTSHGARISNNRFRGPLDLAGGFTRKGDSTFACKIYNNVIGHDTMQSVARKGIILEADVDSMSYVYIYDNEFKNTQSAIDLNFVSTTKYKNIYIYKNLIWKVGVAGNSSWGQAIGTGGSGGTLSNLFIYNNTIVAEHAANYLNAIVLPARSTTGIVYIQNNIVTSFGGKYLTTESGTTGTINTVYVRNNNPYSNGSSNLPSWGGITPSTVTSSGNITSNPSFVSSTDFHLNVGSPAINAGLDGNNIGKY